MKCIFDGSADPQEKLLTLSAEDNSEKELLSRMISENITSSFRKIDGKIVEVTLILPVQPYEVKR